jgi:hypothetical protein
MWLGSRIYDDSITVITNIPPQANGGRINN